MKKERHVRAVALDHFVLRVRDLDKSLAFYRDALALPIQFLDEYRAGNWPFVSVRVGAQLIDLVPDPTFRPDPDSDSNGFLHLCLRIEGKLSDAIAALRDCGVEFIEDEPFARVGACGTGMSIYARDPDGYRVEIKEDAVA